MRLPSRSIFLLATLQLSLVGLVSSVNSQPTVVPSLKSWVGGHGQYHLTHGSRIVVSPNYGKEDDTNSRMEKPANLKQVASVLADDIKTLSSLKVNVVLGAPRHGDIYLQLGTLKNQTSDEAYSMKVSEIVRYKPFVVIIY